MSSSLMDTEAGGESGQYEGDLQTAAPHKKSGGQLGSVETTTDPSDTPEDQQQAADRGAKTAENIRYGQTISEQGGIGGMTQGQDGAVEDEGFGRQEDQTGGSGNGEAGQERRAEGYGESNDMDKEIGA